MGGGGYLVAAGIWGRFEALVGNASSPFTAAAAAAAAAYDVFTAAQFAADIGYTAFDRRALRRYCYNNTVRGGGRRQGR